MNILITNVALTSWTGSELFARDIARGLRARGHEVSLFSGQLGPLADTLRAEGFRVVKDLTRLSAPPDVIHGHHHIETMAALQCFPETPAVYFCHGVIPWEEHAPRHPRIVRYAAVSEYVAEKMILRSGIVARQISIVRNFVDLDRFKPRGPLPARPRRMLVFSNHATEENILPTLREAACRIGLRMEAIGTACGNASSAPEEVLGDYDVVVAGGRAALEALAVGAAVVVGDVEGLGEMVTTRNFDHYRCRNFGISLQTRPVSVENLVSEIQKYDPGVCQSLSVKVREVASLVAAVEDASVLYQQAIAGFSKPTPREEALAFLEYQRWLTRSVREDLIAPRAVAEDEVRRLQSRSDRLAAELGGVKGSLSWRLSQRLGQVPGASRLLRTAQRVAPVAWPPIDAPPSAPMEISPGPSFSIGRCSGDSSSPGIVALCSFHNDSAYLPGLLDNLHHNVDGLVALDDGSTDGSSDLVDAHPITLNLIRRPPRDPHVWDEEENQRMLIQSAWETDASWCIAIDADERLENDFHRKARVVIDRADAAGQRAGNILIRTLWNQGDTCRVDGNWRNHRSPRFFVNSRDHVFDTRKLHRYWASLSAQVDGLFPDVDLIIYHLRMIHSADRKMRRQKYEQLDGDHRWQAIGYDHLTDEDGLTLERIHPQRDYAPREP